MANLCILPEHSRRARLVGTVGRVRALHTLLLAFICRRHMFKPLAINTGVVGEGSVCAPLALDELKIGFKLLQPCCGA